MASRQQKRQSPRNTTNIVVRNGSSANQAGPSRAQQARRRRNRTRRQARVNVRVLPNQSQGRRRVLRRQGVGDRVVFQKINTTLGTVGSNESGEIECELTCLMNPATMKEVTGSNSFGPLGIYASTYTLYKMTRCVVTLKPIVGDSAVAGTVTRVSWNPTSSPTQTSWSALGARKHVDVTPGKTGRFVLTGKDLVGPKGGWFKTNTKGDPMMCFAGTLECHTFGKTTSTYRNEPFKGGLFLAELETTWQFKDYGQQPGMLNLIKGEDTHNARIETGEGDKLQLVLPRNSRMARAATTTPSEIIWVVTDTIIQAGAALIPPPFGWLIRGGWWLVKRAAGAPVRANDNEIRFDIYASISDARSNTPCILQQRIDTPVQVGGLNFQQVTPGNTGMGTDIPLTRAIDYPLEPTPPGNPTRIYITKSTMLKLGTETEVPSVCAWYNNNGGQNHNNKGVGFVCNGTKVCSFTVHKVEVLTDVGPADVNTFTHKVPFKIYNNTTANLGNAVASAYVKANESPNLWISSVLVHVEYARREVFSAKWDTTTATYPTADYQVQITTRKGTNNSNLYINMQPGWYIVQYAVYGRSEGSYMVGQTIIATRGTGEVSTETHTFNPHASHFGTGLFPAYMTGLALTPFTTDEVTYSTTLRVGDDTAVSDLESSFGCDDASEFPPPPSEEDFADDVDEFEDPEGPEDEEDEELELGPDDDYSDPPISRLVVHPDARQVYEQLRAKFPEREARLAANQLIPSGEYAQFTEMYHNALVDGLSPREARAFALGL
ncbi:capsid protein [Mamastrovirus 2]|uniref:Capsid protein n=1 Tax=Mamastrovirus 2 TaxID=1239566 RepID=A0A1Y0DDD8_9VIRU|nr:capsid protein [Mamastrovirus 2]ART85577.1 capsid protein [Mamastrovirus 2]